MSEKTRAPDGVSSPSGATGGAPGRGGLPTGWNESLRRRVLTAGAAISRPPLPEAAMGLAVAVVVLLPAWRNALPVGYGGFFVLMAEQLTANGFALPLEVPFYGPGGTPFAYPPLGMYLMALATGPLGVPGFTYLRYVPALCGVALTVVVYGLALRLTGRRWVALIATALVMTSSTVLEYHTTAAGVVRGPALVFSLAGLWAAVAAFEARRPSVGPVIGATLMFALTLLSHLSYAVFFMLSLVAFAVAADIGTGEPWRRRMGPTVAIIVGGAMIASPWWLTVIWNWGVDPFVSAVSSHGGFGLLTAALTLGSRFPAYMVDALVGVGGRWTPVLVPGLAVAGFGLLLVRRRWLIPAWAAVVFLGVGESDRYLALIGGIAAAVLLGAVSGHDVVEGTRGDRHPVISVLPSALVVALCLLGAAVAQFRIQPALSPPLLDVATWMRERTPSASRYVDLIGSHDIGEWLPYLTRRTPAIAPWGAEWTGRYLQQSRLWRTLNRCARQQSLDCVDWLLDLRGARTDYVVVPVAATQVLRHLGAGGWTEVHRNASFSVVRRTPADTDRSQLP